MLTDLVELLINLPYRDMVAFSEAFMDAMGEVFSDAAAEAEARGEDTVVTAEEIAEALLQAAEELA